MKVSSIYFENLKPSNFLILFIFSLLVICLTSNKLLAQNTLITDDASATTESSAVLNIHSDSKGLLIPRLTKSARLAIPSPPQGLVVYETTNKRFYAFIDTEWTHFIQGEKEFDYSSSLNVIRNQNNLSADFIIGRSSLPGSTSISGDMLFYDKSKSAFRMGSLSNSNVWRPDSVGTNSIGMGLNANASGVNAVSIGYENNARGDYSTALGYYNTAYGNYSTVLGYFNQSAGDFSMASGLTTNADGNISTTFGNGTKANAKVSMAIGQYNVGGGTADDWKDKDPLFEIGNGISEENRRNALTVLKNGDFIVGFNKLPISGDILTETLFFFDYSNGAFRGGSLFNSSAWNSDMIGENSFAYGYNNLASGHASISLGENNTALGTNNTTIGYNNMANGYASVAIGADNISNGYASTAWGNQTTSSGIGSTSSGFNTNANGYYSTSMGNSTIATAQSCLAIGQFNIGAGTNNEWIETEPLFEIGNGDNLVNRSNALTVLKNGRIGVKTHEPDGVVHIKHNSSSLDPHLILEEDGSSTDYTRLNLKNTTQTAYWSLAGRPNDVSLVTARFNLYYSNLGNILTAYGNGNISVPQGSLMFGDVTSPSYRLELPNNGSLIEGRALARSWDTYSDKRVKSNVQTTRYGLNEILKLNPVSYMHHSSKFENGHLIIDQEDKVANIGFIAQEVYKIIEEVVTKPDNEEQNLWAMDYEKLTPVLVKAIQEQESMIQAQQSDLRIQKNRIEMLEKQLEEITSLVQQLAQVNK